MIQMGLTIREISTDSETAKKLLVKNPRRIAHPWRKTIVVETPKLTVPLYWVKGHKKDTSQMSEHALRRRRGMDEVDLAAKRASLASQHGAVPKLPWQSLPFYMIKQSKTNTLISLKSIVWPVPSWQDSVPPLTNREQLLWAIHPKNPAIVLALIPLFYRHFLAYGLGSKQSLPTCCQKFSMGARHECKCQARMWSDMLAINTNYRISIPPSDSDDYLICIAHKDNLTDHYDCIISTDPVRGTCDWALVPWFGDLNHDSLRLAPSWAKCVKMYAEKWTQIRKQQRLQK